MSNEIEGPPAEARATARIRQIKRIVVAGVLEDLERAIWPDGKPDPMSQNRITQAIERVRRAWLQEP